MLFVRTSNNAPLPMATSCRPSSEPRGRTVPGKTSRGEKFACVDSDFREISCLLRTRHFPALPDTSPPFVAGFVFLPRNRHHAGAPVSPDLRRFCNDDL